MNDVYHCDGCGEPVAWNETFWFTSSIGFCEKCSARLESKVPLTVLYGNCAYSLCDSGDNEAAEFVINMARPEKEETK